MHGSGGRLLPGGTGWPFRMSLALVVNRMDPVVKPAENHFPGRGLKNAGDGDINGARDHLLGVVYNHHGTVVQIRDSLVVLLAFLENEDAHRFTWQHDRLEGVGELVDVQDFDAMKLGDFVQVEIVGDDLAVVHFGKLNQLHVHFMDVGKIILENLDVELSHLLNALQNVQASAPAVTFERIARVRHQLQFTQHELRDHQCPIQKTSLDNIGYAAIDNDTGIQDLERLAGRLLAPEQSAERAEVQHLSLTGAHQQSDIGHPQQQQQLQKGNRGRIAWDGAAKDQ